MTRKITEHAIDEADPIQVLVTDEAGKSGANHRYEVWGFDASRNPSCPEGWNGKFTLVTVLFQNGPVRESGFNGLTQEVLLAIVADRLRSFQQGPYPSEDNAEALDYVQKALAAMKRNTRDRIVRGEG